MSQVIYAPRGRALEYSLLGLELFVGCRHQCTYCYVPGASRRTKDQWRQLQPYVRGGVLRSLAKEAPTFRGRRERVLLCFMSDPYQPDPALAGTTRAALEILAENEVPFQVLTKGGLDAAGDFDLYTQRDAFAVTLTCNAKAESAAYEPGAAPPMARRMALYEAHQRGIETWVSLEPVVDPEWSLDIIRETHEYVDLYKIGKINHDPGREASIDWLRFAWQAVTLCERFGVRYYVKKDLAAYCDFAFRQSDNRRAGWKEAS